MKLLGHKLWAFFILTGTFYGMLRGWTSSHPASSVWQDLLSYAITATWQTESTLSLPIWWIKTWFLIDVFMIEHHEWASFQVFSGYLHFLFCDLSVTVFNLFLIVNLFISQFSHLLNWDFKVSAPAYPAMLFKSRVKQVVKRELAFM